MRKSLAVLGALLLGGSLAFGQAKSTRMLAAGEANCPAAGAAPGTIMAAHPTRMSYAIVVATAPVRIAMTTATVAMSALNSIAVSTVGVVSDQYPSIGVGPIKCNSQGATATTVSFWEFGQ